jgi:hypothetical protein|tara:strand:- start:71 stop:1099 length:1029 start_codon:yes stop_codon:yes gene_type:complete
MSVQFRSNITNQNITLNSGWNFISLCVEIDFSDFVEIDSNIIEILDFNGLLWKKSNVDLGLGFLNNLNIFYFYNSYYVKCNSNINITISGREIKLISKLLPNDTWTTFPFCYLNNMLLSDVVTSDIESNFKEILDFDGLLWKKSNIDLGLGFLNNLSEFVSGKGYYFKSSSDYTFALQNPNDSTESIVLSRDSNQLQIALPAQDSIGNFRYGKKDSVKGIITAMTIFFDGPLSLTGTLPTIASHNVTHDSANNALDIYSESNIVLEEAQIYNVLESSNVTGTLPQISRIELGMGIYVDGDDTEYEDELLYTSSSADATAYSIPQYKYHDASLINIYSDGILV